MGGRRAAYGFDAPPALLGLGFGALAFVAGAVLAEVFGLGLVALALALVAVTFLVQFALYLHSTRRGKFQVWEELLDGLDLRGNERLLDLGPGRGAVLLAAAKRLPDGHAVGVDLWRSVDQSGNSRETTESNAEAEGVTDRIELETGDITELPFPDNDFDVVVSSLTIHNIHAPAARATAVREALRVLRPGGHLVIADISKASEYQKILSDNGAQHVTQKSLGWRMWYGSPWLATRVVRATAP